jgi:hypothetical protein
MFYKASVSASLAWPKAELTTDARRELSVQLTRLPRGCLGFVVRT